MTGNHRKASPDPKQFNGKASANETSYQRPNSSDLPVSNAKQHGLRALGRSPQPHVAFDLSRCSCFSLCAAAPCAQPVQAHIFSAIQPPCCLLGAVGSRLEKSCQICVFLCLDMPWLKSSVCAGVWSLNGVARQRLAYSVFQRHMTFFWEQTFCWVFILHHVAPSFMCSHFVACLCLPSIFVSSLLRLQFTCFCLTGIACEKPGQFSENGRMSVRFSKHIFIHFPFTGVRICGMVWDGLRLCQDLSKYPFWCAFCCEGL